METTRRQFIRGVLLIGAVVPVLRPAPRVRSSLTFDQRSFSGIVALEARTPAWKSLRLTSEEAKRTQQEYNRLMSIRTDRALDPASRDAMWRTALGVL